MIDVKEFFITRYKLFGFALQMWRHKHLLWMLFDDNQTNNPQLKMYDSDIQSRMQQLLVQKLDSSTN
jgi:hypothetical protein